METLHWRVGARVFRPRRQLFTSRRVFTSGRVAARAANICNKPPHCILLPANICKAPHCTLLQMLHNYCAAVKQISVKLHTELSFLQMILLQLLCSSKANIDTALSRVKLQTADIWRRVQCRGYFLQISVKLRDFCAAKKCFTLLHSTKFVCTDAQCMALVDFLCAALYWIFGYLAICTDHWDPWKE